MHVLIAPNAFKNSLSADAAAAAILRGLEESALTFTAECFPVGDGGDGTGDLLMARLDARRMEVSTRDPFFRSRPTYYGLTPDHNTAIIEMANASGLRLLDNKELDPLIASSIGTGDLLRAALTQDPRRILLCMGGSATVDAGIGILSALGIRFLDSAGNELPPVPIHLARLEAIDASGLDPRLSGKELSILTDVDNPLLGPNGATAIFGPQKGASPEAVKKLETALQQLAAIVQRQLGIDLSSLPSGGAAGGAAAGLHGLLGAKLVHGIDYFLDITGFDKALERAQWVITGEGSIDEQTLQGKGPFGVASRAKKKAIPVLGLAGQLPTKRHPGLDNYFHALLPINHSLLPLPAALAHTAVNLTATARAVGNLLAMPNGVRPAEGPT
jgi:glycerate 2-kinase